MNQPINTAFSFEGYKISHFSFDVPDNNEESVDIDFKPSGLFVKSDNRYMLQFDFNATYKTETGEIKNMLTATIHATFKFKETIEFEKIPDYFYTNSIAIVFPYLRAFVSTLTVLGNINLLLLPLLNLSHLKEPLKENTIVMDDVK